MLVNLGNYIFPPLSLLISSYLCRAKTEIYNLIPEHLGEIFYFLLIYKIPIARTVA